MPIFRTRDVISSSLWMLLKEGLSLTTLAMIALFIPLGSYWVVLQSGTPSIFAAIILAVSISYLHLGILGVAAQSAEHGHVDFKHALTAPFKNIKALIVLGPLTFLVVKIFMSAFFIAVLLYPILLLTFAAATLEQCGPWAAMKKGFSFLKAHFGLCLKTWISTAALQGFVVTAYALLAWNFAFGAQLFLHLKSLVATLSGDAFSVNIADNILDVQAITYATFILVITATSFLHPIMALLMFKYGSESEN